ncbi:MAG: c-type cytochrome [Anaerolineae bacterium]|nr:c-type cytochrome [Anaerolineae bacterium]
MRNTLRRVALVLGATALVTACTVSPRPTLPVEVLLTPAALPTPALDGESAPMRPPDVEAGALIYEQKCAACHGLNGAGDGPQAATIRAQGRMVPSLVDPARFRVAEPAEWHQIITVGRLQNLMPGFSGSLNGQQRWDVQSYLWALSTSPQELSEGRALYQAQCASCHGSNGELAVGNPGQAFNDMRFLAAHSLLDLSNLMVQGEAHRGVRLTEEERFKVAQVVRSFGYLYADPAKVRLARTKGDGALKLQVFNGTPGGRIVTGTLAVLRAYDSNGEVFTRTAQVAPDGTIAFTDLPRRADYFYQAELDYGDGRFYAAPVQFDPAGNTLITGTLPIFETTEDDSAIRISEAFVFVQDVRPQQITVVEFYRFDNLSDRAYIGKPSNGGRRYTLRLTKPEGAQNLRFDGLGLGQRFFDEDGVIYDTDAVVPGRGATQVVMLYELPYRGDRLEFRRQVFYPTDRWDMLVPELEGVREQLRVEGLNDRGRQVLNNSVVYLFSANAPLAAGERISFSLVGRIRPADVPGGDGRAIGFGLVALGLTVAVAYFVLMRVRAIRAGDRSLAEARRALVSQIAALDDAYAKGKIAEDYYREQRERLKSELRAIWE